MRGGVISDGYRGVSLRRDGKRYPRKVSRLILETFVGPRPSRYQCCHLNGIRLDDRLANLMWGHHLINMQHRDEHGNTARGERQWKAKLTEDKVRQIHSLLGSQSLVAIGRQFNVAYTTIARIRDGLSWAHVAPSMFGSRWHRKGPPRPLST